MRGFQSLEKAFLLGILIGALIASKLKWFCINWYSLVHHPAIRKCATNGVEHVTIWMSVTKFKYVVHDVMQMNTSQSVIRRVSFMSLSFRTGRAFSPDLPWGPVIAFPNTPQEDGAFSTYATIHVHSHYQRHKRRHWMANPSTTYHRV